MTSPLLAYHSNPAIKSKYLRRVRAHMAADELVKGVYWENGHGCGVGCTIHSSRHENYEPELGIPWQLAVIEDNLFEMLPNAHAMTWPDHFLSAITPGADLSMVGKRWLAWLVRDTAGASRDDAERDIVLRMADLMDRSIAGDEPTREQWDSAAGAAGAARDALAAWAAWAAWDAWDAWDAGDAWDAWDAGDAWAAWAAWDARDALAAWAAGAADKAVIRMSEKLLELLTLAPLP